MAIFTPPPIKFKRSHTPGAVPDSEQLLVGELAINIADRIIYTKDSDGIITELGKTSDIDSDILAIKARLLVMEIEEDSDNAVTRADHDSDLLMTYHDFRAADSDLQYQLDSEITWIRQRLLDLEAEEDSDNAVTRADHDSDLLMTYHDFRAADSDIRRLLQDTIDSDITKLYHDYRAADSDFRVEYDSDIPQLYHDYQSADSDIRRLLQDTIDSDIAKLYHDYQAADSDLYVNHDSDLFNLELGNLFDVDLNTILPAHGQVLTYDSDSDKWVATYVQTITEQVRQTFYVTVNGTSEFVLSNAPSGEVQFTRNAMILNNTASYLDSEVIVHYVPANNNNQQLRVGDQIDLTYVKHYTSTIPSFIR